MNKEEFDISQELEQMRQDYAVLKERFDKQEIFPFLVQRYKNFTNWARFPKTILQITFNFDVTN